jgi:tRNA(Ile)-lysidine synthase
LEVATVDHGLRPESAGEARFVEDVCAAMGIPHVTLHPQWVEAPRTGVQEKARAARYGALGRWAIERRLAAVATAHHREDQAETLMMRLARGAGVRGLAGMRPEAQLPDCPAILLLRPLLHWSKRELQNICRDAHLAAVVDSCNADSKFERVRVRKALEANPWLDPDALARSAAHLAEADEALEWAAAEEWSRVARDDSGLTYRPTAPQEVRRRVVARALLDLAHEGTGEPRGRELERLMATLESGGTATLRGVRCAGGSTWRFTPAAARRPTWNKPR